MRSAQNSTSCACTECTELLNSDVQAVLAEGILNRPRAKPSSGTEWQNLGEKRFLPWVDAKQHRWRRLQPRPLMCHSPHPPCANHLTPPGHTQHSGAPLATLCYSTAHCCSCAALPHLQAPGDHPVCSRHCHATSLRLISRWKSG